MVLFACFVALLPSRAAHGLSGERVLVLLSHLGCCQPPSLCPCSFSVSYSLSSHPLVVSMLLHAHTLLHGACPHTLPNRRCDHGPDVAQPRARRLREQGAPQEDHLHHALEHGHTSHPEAPPALEGPEVQNPPRHTGEVALQKHRLWWFNLINNPFFFITTLSLCL